MSFKASDRWTIGASAAYARSRIKNGLLPCNNFSPNPPPAGVAGNNVIRAANGGNPAAVNPTTGEILGGETIGTCRVNYSASRTSPFSFTLQSEYNAPISPSVDGFARGLLTFNGASRNDPANAIDDVDAYALTNLYAGIRDPDGAWEVSLFAKNLFDVNRVVSRNPFVASGAVQIGRSAGQINSTYRTIQTLPPREFGVNVRYAFGSR